jgi:uncharacterized protein (TIGR02246 family)
MSVSRRPLTRRAIVGISATSVAAVAITSFALAGAGATEEPATATVAGAPSVAPTEDELRAEARALFDDWNAALATGDPAAVDAKYAEDAVLLPTVSPGIHETSEERLAYFEGFLQNEPQGVITEDVVQSVGPDAISHSGLYSFTMGATGDVVPARFTFDWKKVDGEWRIVEHHSSKEPVKE